MSLPFFMVYLKLTQGVHYGKAFHNNSLITTYSNKTLLKNWGYFCSSFFYFCDIDKEN